MKKFYKLLCWLIIFTYILFIFTNSLANGLQSGNLSLKVVNIVVNIFPFLISFNIHYFIRKLAHFLEFFILGFLLSLTINKYPLIKNKTLNYIPFLLIPFIDEAIQYFVPGRASSLIDVLIDLSGMLIPIVLLNLKKVVKP